MLNNSKCLCNEKYVKIINVKLCKEKIDSIIKEFASFLL